MPFRCTEALLGDFCGGNKVVSLLHKVQPLVVEHSTPLFGAAAGVVLVLMIATKVGWLVGQFHQGLGPHRRLPALRA